jgi:hypothetical protein
MRPAASLPGPVRLTRQDMQESYPEFFRNVTGKDPRPYQEPILRIARSDTLTKDSVVNAEGWQ